MKRLKWMGSKLAQGVFAILLIATINFFLVRAAPGDTATVMAGDAGAADQQYVAQLWQQFGLDQPITTQLVTYLGKIVRFDLGYSYRQQQPVLDLIVDRLPATLLLTLSAFLLSLAFGIALGVASAKRVGSWLDSTITFMALFFYATPIYWLALMAVLVFSVQLDWLPGFGFSTVGSGATGIARVLDVLRHLVLPVMTLSLFYMAVYARMTRAAMLEVAQMDFVKTARAKGVSEARILRVHMLRNALLPVVTLAGIQAGGIVGGAVITETVFAWPGLGRLMFDALMQRDYNVLLGAFLTTAVMAVAFNLLTDFIYTWIDPRIELS